MYRERCVYIYIYREREREMVAPLLPAALPASAALGLLRVALCLVCCVVCCRICIVPTPNPPTRIVDVRGFDSRTILILRGGIPRPIGIS